MENLNLQLLAGIYQLLVSNPVQVFFHHSFLIGVFAGVISLLPYGIKRLPHVVVAIIVLFTWYWVKQKLNFSVMQAMYSEKSYFIVAFFGNYIIGCIVGCVIANLIQRVRGEHEYATNN